MRVLTIVVVVLAVLVDGFFALINFYPVAPSRARGPERKVLVALDTAQARWLRENLIDEFNTEHNSNLQLQAVDEEELLPTLAKAQSDVILTMLPRARGRQAIAAHAVRSFEDVATPARVNSDFDAVVPPALQAALVDGKQLFLPGMALVDVLVFRISRVRDAVRHWSLLRAQIDAALREVNGRGLPPNYSLELEPELWDGFDRFVIGYFWAHRRYAHQPARGRVAHRTGEDLDGALDIVEGLYRAGVDDKTVSQTAAPAVRDYFAWEALYRKHGLFPPEMLGEHPLDDDTLVELLRKGELFLASVDTMQAFTLHGGGHGDARPGVDDPDDLGFAPLPRISSLALGSDGKPARSGEPFSFRDDWVWALPARAADAELAYELVQFLWSRENHVRFCEALGALPLRTDVQRERSSIFRLTWMDDVLDAAFAEWNRARPVPDTLAEGFGSVYAQLWDRLIRRQDPIDAVLHTPPAPRPLVSPPVAARAPEAPTSEEDTEDRLDAIDDEQWSSKVELEEPKK
jgi:ABC-type glycerol-3-phosphate transport system substrate-binding protein